MATEYAVDLLFRAPRTTALDQLNRQLAEVDRKARSLGGSDPFQGMENSARGATGAVNGLNVAARGLLATFGPLLAAVSVLGSAKFIFDKTAEVEKQTKSLEVLTGSLEKTRDIIAQLQQYGAVTPFTSSELIDSAKRLNAFGVSADRVVEVTKRLGDVAGATGADLSSIVTAYGQVVAKGRLQGEELLQFQERGVGVLDELRKMYGFTGEEMREALEKGRVSSEALEVAIERLTAKGGKYAGGAIAQSTTLSGKLSTLQDNIESIARAIGQKLTPAIDAVLTKAIQATDAVNKLLNSDARKKEEEYFNRATAEILRREDARFKQGVTPGSTVQPVDGSRPPDGIPIGGVVWTPQMIDQRNRLIAQFKADDALAASLGQGAPKPPSAVPELGAGRGKGSKGDPLSVVVVGGLTGGGQADSSRGRSTGPHLHRQGGSDALVDAALEFPGGRRASDFGLGRGAAAHGYNARDYPIPQGTPFRLRPGWTGTDLGIRGALGRGMRVSGPGGSFELGHLAGVKTGRPQDPFTAAESQARDAERAAEEARQRRLDGLSQEEERLKALASIKTSEAKSEQDRLNIQIKLENDLNFVKAQRAKVEPDPNLGVKAAASAAELAKQQRELREQAEALAPTVTDLERKLALMFDVETDSFDAGVRDLRLSFEGVNKEVDDLLKKLDGLGVTGPEIDKLRQRLSQIKGNAASGAEAAPDIYAKQQAKPLLQGLQGDAERMRLERGAIRQGRGLNQQETLQLDATFKKLPEAQQKVLMQQAALNDSWADGNAKLQTTVDLVQDIGGALAQGIGSAITGLIQGTTTLNEALSQTLANIGQILIQNAVTGLLGQVSIGGIPLLKRASGGPVGAGEVTLVGERGPELMVPRSSGTVVPADQTAAIMDRYQRRSDGRNSTRPTQLSDDAGNAVTVGVRYEVTRVNDMRFVDEETFHRELDAAERRAARAGAEGGHAMVGRDMVNKRSIRSRWGVR